MSPRRLPVATAAVAALVAVVAGGAIGVIVRGSSPATTTTIATTSSVPTIAVGDLRITLPTDWTRADRPLSVPGLSGPRSLAVTSTQGSAVLAQVDPADRSLLPAGLLAALGGEAADVVTAGTPSQIGSVRVVSYTLTVPALLRVYALPTTRGVAVLACTTDFTTCPDVLSAMKVDGGSILGLGPDAALRSRLGGVVADLSAARQTGRIALRDATTPQARATAATDLAIAYRDAAQTLAPLSTIGAQSRATVQTLREIRRDYEALAAAATAQDVAAFTAARAAVATHELELDQVLGRWRVAA